LRNQTFQPEREPLRHDGTFTLAPGRTRGPVSFLNPTHAQYEHHAQENGEPQIRERTTGRRPSEGETQDGLPGKPALTYQWTSRDNRKGRHRIRVPAAALSDQADSKLAPSFEMPPLTSSAGAIRHILWLMLTRYPVWDISFDVAYLFTWGSVVWVVNAFFAWLPLVRPDTEFDGESLYGGGITAFIGATIFELGSILLLLEAVNAGREGCFGWAIEREWDRSLPTTEHGSEEDETADVHNTTDHGSEGTRADATPHRIATKTTKTATSISIRPALEDCTHHHPNKRNLVGKPRSEMIDTKYVQESDREPGVEKTSPRPDRTWTWFPTWHDIRTHYCHELGFIASLVQFLAATIFWIAGFTALPGIFDKLSPAAVNGAYWTPQIIGGAGFIVSGLLFMLETQPNWYTPALESLGWHIGLWNTIGGVGFTLCPAFGYDTSSWAVYQASLSTFWGSWAFLIGSVVQWYESLQKYPVESDKAKR
jgi:hypothetical protein